MEFYPPSAEVSLEEEKRAWRHDAGSISLQLTLHRAPQDLYDVCTAFEEVIAQGVGDLSQGEIDQLRVVFGELINEYGPDRAFWLAINYESPEEGDIALDLDPLVDQISTLEALLGTELTPNLQSPSSTMTPQITDSPTEGEADRGIIEIYLPRDYESARKLPDIE